MNLKSLSLLLLLLTAVVVTACNSAESRKPLVAAPQADGQIETTYADGLARVTIKQLEELIASGNVFIVDVRNQAAYDQGHIPNAKLIPVGEVATRINEFPKDKQIVTYCS